MKFTQKIKSRQKIKKFFQESVFPLGLLLLYFIVFHFQKFFVVPTQNEFFNLVFSYVGHQSLFLIFLIALLEGGFVLGQYAPGGFVIFLSILSAGEDIPRISLLISIICIAYFIAYTIDYAIGYYGTQLLAKKTNFEKKISGFKKALEKNVAAATFFTFWDTNLASFLSVAAGSLKIPYKTFALYSSIFIIFWNIFWAVIIYFFGNIVLDLFGPKYLLLIFIVWLLWIFYKNFVKEEEEILEEAIKSA